MLSHMVPAELMGRLESVIDDRASGGSLNCQVLAA